MKILISIITVLSIFVVAPVMADGKGPPNPERFKVEMAKKAEIQKQAVEMLDSFVGHYTGSVEIDGEMYTASLNINPKFVQDHYYPGYYKLKNSKGEVTYEAATIFCFNFGGMSYFFFYYGSDEYIRSSFGKFTPGAVELSSPMPKGVEHIRYSKVDEDTLKFEKWAPSKAQGKREGDPEQVIIFKKNK